MKLSTLLPSVLLLAAAGVEAAVGSSPPSTHTKLSKTTGSESRNDARKAALEERIQAIQAKKRHSKQQQTDGKRDVSPNAVEVDYNWAGPVIETPPSGETWKTVTATMTLPELVAPSQSYGVLGEYFFYVWVGIDGDNCDTLFQTGFGGEIVNGVTDWLNINQWGWVCWISDDTQFDTYILDASSGDLVNMTVEALSTTEAVFWLDNLSTGASSSYTLTNEALCLGTAEWIVEDPYTEDSQGNIEFEVWPDFGTMTFDGAVATTNTGAAYGPANATFFVIDSYYGDITLNSVSVTDTTASITWLDSAPCCSD